MQRFMTIMLAVVFYLVWGSSEVALSGLSSDASHSDSAYIVSDLSQPNSDLASHRHNGYHDLAELLRHSIGFYNQNAAGVSVANYAPTAEVQHNLSSRSNLRHRTLAEKILSAAIHSRKAGHITKIFEFNPYTSSLRAAYYLHTLCRLRI